MNPDRMKRMFGNQKQISKVKIVVSTAKYVIVAKDNRYEGLFSGNNVIKNN